MSAERGPLARVVDGSLLPGVYRWPSPADPEAVRRNLDAADWTTHVLAGEAVTSGPALFDRCAAALAFPAWFGHNWDALADCLGDLSWLPGKGHVVLWDNYGVLAHADPPAWRLAYQLFADAGRLRRELGALPLFLLL